MNTQDSQSELDAIINKHLNEIKAGHDGKLKASIEVYVTTRVAEATSKPLPRELKLIAKVANLDQKIVMLEADCATRVKEALEAARSKDPHKCEFGHEVYSHNTVDGWCCACEADQAFMDERVKEAERLARIDELNNTLVIEGKIYVRIDGVGHPSITKVQRVAQLATTTNGKEE